MSIPTNLFAGPTVEELTAREQELQRELSKVQTQLAIAKQHEVEAQRQEAANDMAVRFTAAVADGRIMGYNSNSYADRGSYMNRVEYREKECLEVYGNDGSEWRLERQNEHL